VEGVIDESTPLPQTPSERSARVLNAERAYRAYGGNVLRCPGIYGRDRGLHIRVQSGKHGIPGDGTRHVSRIHVEDLAELLLAATRFRGQTFVVGDLEPARHIDVVRFICETYDVPLPGFVPLEHSPRSLQGDRRVNSEHALRTLGVTLRYPNYRMGMAK
jgi:nucleoside-diphosphate-sugar epimerase